MKVSVSLAPEVYAVPEEVTVGVPVTAAVGVAGTRAGSPVLTRAELATGNSATPDWPVVSVVKSIESVTAKGTAASGTAAVSK